MSAIEINNSWILKIAGRCN